MVLNSDREIQKIIILGFCVIFSLYSPILQAIDLDLTTAQDVVGMRFANKFCEAKEEGFSLEYSSDFALNNTYLKFVAFPDDDNFIRDLWSFTRELIRNDCGEFLSENEEANLRDFFEEEGQIASNRDLYLQH